MLINFHWFCFQIRPHLQISMSVSMNREKRTEKSNKSESLILIKPKKEEWKKFSFRSAPNDGIDSGDKQCYLEYRVFPDCYLNLETNNTNCRIPCIMDGCDKELHHFIPCPVWNCEPITTSTTTTSTTSTSTSTTNLTTTTSPRPTPIEPTHMSPWIYSSIVLNIFFFAILFAYLVVKFRVWITIRLANFRAPTNTPINPPDPNEHFSVGSNSDNESDNNETQPLLPPVGKLPQQLPQQGPINSPTTTALRQGYDNLGLHCSNLNPLPSTSNWAECTQAILGGDGPNEQSQNPILPSSSNWDDISLASPQRPEENNGAALNDVEANQTAKPEKSIFLLMKSFKKSK